MKRLKIFIGLLSIAPIISHAAGYEKATMWSGKWSSLGGAGVGAVGGSDSLVLNPAGLVSGESKELSVNLSSTISSFEGVYTRQNKALQEGVNVESETGVSIIPSVIYKHKLSDNIAIGAGVYVSAGTNSEYENLSFSQTDSAFDNLTPTVNGKLKSLEFSLGGAYKINNNWSVGAAWRGALIRAEFSSASVSYIANSTNPALLVAAQLTDLEDEQYDGFRLGTQYKADSGNWGLGLSWRSAMNFSAEGTAAGKQEKATATGGSTSDDATDLSGINQSVTVTSLLPQMINLGGFYKASTHLTLFTEFRWIEYSKVDALGISGAARTNMKNTLTNAAVLSDIKQDWKDQYSLHFGGECLVDTMAYRLGYSVGTQVVPTEHARITFSGPGLGHGLAAGAGTKLMDGKLSVDFAGEYSWAKGDGNTSVSSTTPIAAGDFSSSAFTAHLSSTYNF